MCDEIKEITYKENNNKNIQMKNRKKVILKIKKKIHPGGFIHIWLMSV